MECFDLSEKHGILNLLTLLCCFSCSSGLSYSVLLCYTFFYQYEHMKRCLEMCIRNKQIFLMCVFML